MAHFSTTSQADNMSIRPQSTHRQWPKGNRFLNTVHDIAEDLGYPPQQIVPLFQEYTSNDFICGCHSRCVPKGDQIPEEIWETVCNHYNCSLSRQIMDKKDKSGVDQVTFQNQENPEFYVGANLTARLIQNGNISEQFSTAQQLHQYLQWTLWINKLAQTSVTMEDRNGQKVVLFDVELHDQRGQTLYALCTPNDMVSLQSQPWQLAHLWRASKLTSWLGIISRSLPRGVRTVSPQFERYRNLTNSQWLKSTALKWLKSKIQDVDLRRKPNQYAQVKCMESGDDDGVVVVSLSTFYMAVRSALVDDEVDLIPILSILSESSNFSVDYLLPIKLKGQWIGVVYREMVPIMVLMDRDEIANKAMLCDPSFNTQSLCRFRECSTRLQIVPIGRFGRIQHAEPGAQRPRSKSFKNDDSNLSKDSKPRLVDNGSMISTVSEPGAPTKCNMHSFVTMNDDESTESPYSRSITPGSEKAVMPSYPPPPAFSPSSSSNHSPLPLSPLSFFSSSSSRTDSLPPSSPDSPLPFSPPFSPQFSLSSPRTSTSSFSSAFFPPLTTRARTHPVPFSFASPLPLSPSSSSSKLAASLDLCYCD